MIVTSAIIRMVGYVSRVALMAALIELLQFVVSLSLRVTSMTMAVVVHTVICILSYRICDSGAASIIVEWFEALLECVCRMLVILKVVMLTVTTCTTTIRHELVVLDILFTCASSLCSFGPLLTSLTIDCTMVLIDILSVVRLMAYFIIAYCLIC